MIPHQQSGTDVKRLVFLRIDGHTPPPPKSYPGQRLEREYYERAKRHNTRKRQEDIDRLTKLKHNLRDLPKQRQCHRYRWTQTETTFDVEIPMLKACKEEDLYLVVERDQLQVAIKTDESFGAITVRSCSYSSLCSCTVGSWVRRSILVQGIRLIAIPSLGEIIR